MPSTLTIAIAAFAAVAGGGGGGVNVCGGVEGPDGRGRLGRLPPRESIKRYGHEKQ